MDYKWFDLSHSWGTVLADIGTGTPVPLYQYDTVFAIETSTETINQYLLLKHLSEWVYILTNEIDTKL